MSTPGKKTYWHLGGERRLPSEYEIVTSRLLYHPNLGFEVGTPIARWYEESARDSPIRGVCWETFRDPRETTYASYTALQARQESFLGALVDKMGASGQLAELDEAWLDRLEEVIPPLRYPWHALSQIAAFVGSCAPEGKIVVAVGFHAADEVRRVQWAAYLMRYLQTRRPSFGSQAKEHWLREGRWQPMRRAVESLLVTYGWEEAFVAMMRCLEPAFDFLLAGLAAAAKRAGDLLLFNVAESFLDDSAWHAKWSGALEDVMRAGAPGNAALVDEWIAKWRLIADAGVAPLRERIT